MVVTFYACVTFYLAKTAHEQMVYSERPWLGPGPIDITAKLTANKAMNVVITIMNSGKSPALHVFPKGILRPIVLPAGDSRVPFIKDPDIIDCSKSKLRWPDNLGGAMVLPGSPSQNFELNSPPLNQESIDILTDKTKTANVSDEALKDIPRADTSTIGTTNWMLGLYLVGCFDYFDEFHQSHRTSFCYFYKLTSDLRFPNGNFGGCPSGNYPTRNNTIMLKTLACPSQSSACLSVVSSSG